MNCIKCSLDEEMFLNILVLLLLNNLSPGLKQFQGGFSIMMMVLWYHNGFSGLYLSLQAAVQHLGRATSNCILYKM